MLEVLPLSPVRECAISRSFMITASQYCTDGETRSSGSKAETTPTTSRADLVTPPAAGRAVGVERLNFIPDPHRVGHVVGAPGDPHPHFIGLGSRRQFLAVQGIDADQVEPCFRHRNTGKREAFAHDLQRQPATPDRAGTGIGDLAFADIGIRDSRSMS